MKVIIAEKPSLAKNIANAIDLNMQKKDGYYLGKDYIVTYAFGHLFRLYDIEMYKDDYSVDKKYHWTLDDLPYYPEQFKFGLQRDSGIIKQYKVIRELINRDDCDAIINAGDSDREGEIIVRLIISYALKKNTPIKRLWMPDQTPQTIKQELEKMRDDKEFDNLANEGLARTYVDWLYGINLTRYASIKANTMLRVGRVIAPIVKTIYDRDMAINSFVPRKYYVLSSKEKTNGEFVELVCKKEFKEDEYDKINQLADTYNKLKCVVKKVSNEEKIIPPGKLFSLSKLQGVLGKKYKMSLDESLQIVQDLYEKGYVSYPRTPSQYLAENEKDKFKEIISNFASLGVKIKFKDSKSIFDDSKIESHSALTPTYKIPKKSELSEKENLVYQEIVHRFFAVFSKENLVVSRSTMEIELKDNVELFKIVGDIVINKGWTIFEDNERKDKLLPNLKENDEVNILFKPVKKETTPPKRFTVETLNNFLKNPFKNDLKELEESEEKDDIEEIKAMFEGVELGTEATRTGIIENACKSNYISLKDNTYHLEPLGKYYVETLDKLKVLIPKEKTAELGKSLKMVYRGEIDIDQALKIAENEIDNVFNQDVSFLEIDKPPRIFEVAKEKQLCKCPRCGQIIAVTDYGYRCSNSGCSLTLVTDNKLFQAINKKITKTMAKQIFTKGKVEFDDLISKKTGSTYSCTLVADFTQKYVSFKFVFPSKDEKKE